MGRHTSWERAAKLCAQFVIAWFYKRERVRKFDPEELLAAARYVLNGPE